MATKVTLHIGKRLRKRRRILGLTLPELEERSGVKFRQIHQCELGARMTTERLYLLALGLGVPPSFFYEGLPGFERPANDHDESLEIPDALLRALARRYETLSEQKRRAFTSALLVLLEEDSGEEALANAS